MNTAEQINAINLCRAFIAKRPSLDARDYIRDWRDVDGRAAYRRDARTINQHLKDARAMLNYCAANGVDITTALRVSGERLFINADGALEYHVGQYWPTEYRAAVARAAANSIFHHWNAETGTGDLNFRANIHAKARREFGRGIASRWFR